MFSIRTTVCLAVLLFFIDLVPRSYNMHEYLFDTYHESTRVSVSIRNRKILPFPTIFDSLDSRTEIDIIEKQFAARNTVLSHYKLDNLLAARIVT